MKLTFSTLGCPDWSLDRIASNAKNYGYDGIELRTHADGNHLSPDVALEDAATLAAQFRETGVPILSIMGYSRFAFADPEEIEANCRLLNQLVDIAAAMEAPFVRSFVGGVPKGTRRRDLIRPIAEALTRCADRAAEKNVRIGLETHDDWCVASNLMTIIKLVDSPSLGVIYDIFNALCGSGESWKETYFSICNHLCYCHVKDGWFLPDGRHEYVFIGAGDVPFHEVFAQLKKDGYDSLLSFEWEKKWVPELPEPEQAFPHYVYKVKQIWNHV